MSHRPCILSLCVALAAMPAMAAAPMPVQLGGVGVGPPRLVGKAPGAAALSGAGAAPALTGEGRADALIGEGAASALVGEGKADALVGEGDAPPLRVQGPAPVLVVAPGPAPVAKPIPAPIVIPDALFAYDSAALNASAHGAIAQAAALIRKAGPGTVRIVGHTDTRGSWDYNLRLSRARAKAVKSALVQLGIPAGQIFTVGRAYAEPVRAGFAEADHAANRRVEVHFP